MKILKSFDMADYNVAETYIKKFIEDDNWSPESVRDLVAKMNNVAERVLSRDFGFTTKTLTNIDIEDVKKNVSDVKVVGDGNLFELLCKASSEKEGWMKSTKAMEITNVGCVVQVTTQQRNHDGTNSIAEAVTFVPDVTIVDDENGGRKLVSQ